MVTVESLGVTFAAVVLTAAGALTVREIRPRGLMAAVFGLALAFTLGLLLLAVAVLWSWRYVPVVLGAVAAAALPLSFPVNGEPDGR